MQAVPGTVKGVGMQTSSELLLSPMPGEMLTKLLETYFHLRKMRAVGIINLKMPPSSKIL